MNSRLNAGPSGQLLASKPGRSSWGIYRPLIVVGLILTLAVSGSHVRAASISLGASRDNTLFRYDPTDTSLSLNSNGSGNFFAAGSTLQHDALRRGLLCFDLASVPAGQEVVPGSLKLQLYVVDVPKRDPAARPFWMIPVVDSAWGEGASQTTAGVSGAGVGAPAQLHDATWFHSEYDPATHAGQPFQPGGPGYWQAPGILGDGAFNAAAQLGAPLGLVASQIGGVTFAGAGLEDDVNQWLSGQENLGWLVLGDETLTGDNEAGVRSFGSREHANPNFRPLLTFETRAVPEPGAGMLIGLGFASLIRRARRRR